MRTKSGLVISCLLLSATTLARGQVETYLPMHVGDSWTYVSDDGGTRVFSIIAQRMVGDHVYYEYDDFFNPCGFPGWPEDEASSSLFRRDQDSNILLQYDPLSESDVVRYDFSSDSWGPFGNQLVEGDIVYRTPAGDFDHSVRFAYATLVDCGVFHETLAPGVGPVGFFSSWEGEYRLQSYSIVSEPSMNLGVLIAIVFGLFARRPRADASVYDGFQRGSPFAPRSYPKRERGGTAKETLVSKASSLTFRVYFSRVTKALLEASHPIPF